MTLEEGCLRESSDWLRKAEHDLMAAKQLSGMADPLSDIICFHAQQTAEKCLKAFLVFHRIEAPRTHDLSICLTQCRNLDPAFSCFEDAADTLTPYAVSTRYPDDSFEYPIEDGLEALRLADEIYTFVYSRIVP